MIIDKGEMEAELAEEQRRNTRIKQRNKIKRNSIIKEDKNIVFVINYEEQRKMPRKDPIVKA